MSENFTAEDFAQANLATKGRFDVARRTDPSLAHQWHVYGNRQGYFSDEEMAADGWVPVMESRITEATLRHVEERAERKRQKLIAHIESVEAAVRDRNRTIEELYVARQEASRRESAAHDRVVTLLDTKKAHEQTIAELRHSLAAARDEIVDLHWENHLLEPGAEGVVSLDGLAAAWEAAEEADECRKGDVLIRKLDRDDYNVYRADAESHELSADTRILSRAPKREPWADLADIIGRYDGYSGSPAELARFLHENEVTTPSDHDAGRVTGGDE